MNSEDTDPDLTDNMDLPGVSVGLNGKLVNEPVLLVDCQTTGASPVNGHLLEVGWGVYRASKPVDVFREFGINTRLVQLPEGARIPDRIRSITGIRSEDLNEAPTIDQVWKALVADVESVPRTVIHYAQFELRFLNALSEQFDFDGDFDSFSICTHRIARRLLPDLPREGIVAQAGYWGHEMQEKNRSRPHVEATAVIWKNLIQELHDREDISTLKELEHWMRRSPEQHKQNERYRYLIDRDRRLDLPDKPGVYRLLNRHDSVLYVGKASSLKDRVNSYFQSRSSLSERKLELVSQVADVEVTPQPTPLEAAIEECNLIKSLEPPYNKKLIREQENIWWSSKDWKSVSTEPRYSPMDGPFLNKQAPRILRQILTWAQTGDLDRVVKGDPLKHLRSQEQFDSGLEKFLEQYAVSPSLSRDRLMELGINLWQRTDDDSPDSSEEQTRQEDSSDSDQTTAVEIAHALEQRVKLSTRTIRRGRWFRDIHSCTLVWRPDRGPLEGAWRGLNVVGGEVKDRQTFDEFQRPDRWRKGFTTDDIGVETVDRLRVFTRELKRLLRHNETSKSRQVYLHCPGKDVMSGEEISKRLCTI